MLKMKCCGEERTTKFCPACGKKLEHPLCALHRHLDGIVKIDAAKLDTIKKDMKERDTNPAIHSKRVARVEKTLAKWTLWRDAVHDALFSEPKEPKIDTASSKKPGKKEPVSRPTPPEQVE